MTDDTQTPGLIPDQPLSNIQKGDCVLFLEADLSLSYEGAPLSRPELATALAEVWPANRLGVAKGTVYNTMSGVYGKLGVRGVTPAVLEAALLRHRRFDVVS